MLPIATLIKKPAVKAGLAVGVIVLLVALLFGAIRWYDNKLTEAFNAGRNDVIQRQNELTIEDYQKQNAEAQKAAKELQYNLTQSQKRIDTLRNTLTVEHDFDKLLQEKPGLILNRVNEGTEEIYNELEELTND